MDYGRRIALLNGRINSHGLDSFLVTGETNVSYLSGFAAGGSMMLFAKGKKFFITDPRYMEEAEEKLKGFTMALMTDSADSTIMELARANRLRRMGFESMDMPYAVASRLKKLLAGTKLAPTKGLVEDLRSVKDADEVSAIRRSVRLAKAVFARTLRSLKAGITEEALAKGVEMDFLKNGAQAAFSPIVAAGRNSSKPHATPGSSRIRNDSFVMMDIGCRLKGYCSDITRTVLLGAMKEKFAEIYMIVREAQKKAIAKVREGARISEVDFAARGYIHSRGFGKYFTHSTGHGVGMDIHEQPTVSRKNGGLLRKGMVFTIEPAIYLPGFGGVRIEDMVLVAPKGCEILTQEERDVH